MRQPVAVYWIDAAGDRDNDQIDPVPSLTTGFIVEATEDKLRIASEVGNVGGKKYEHREFTVIPSDMVLAIKKLTKLNEPEDVYAYVLTKRKKLRKR